MSKENDLSEEEKKVVEIIWERLEKTFKEFTPWESLDHSAVTDYSAYRSKNYVPDMFIDTKCENAVVHSYDDMMDILGKLCAGYPGDLELISAGLSEGYGGPENALDIWAIQMQSIEESKQTAFFFAGHHPEFSGPEAVQLIAQRLAEAYQAGNKNVEFMRKNTTLFFVPQIDPDLYNNLEGFEDLHDHYKKAYSWLIDESDPKQREMLRTHQVNLYNGSQEDFLRLAQSDAIEEFVHENVDYHGLPILAIDYHEAVCLNKFSVSKTRAPPPLYIFAEVAKHYPVMNKYEIDYLEEGSKSMQKDFATLSKLLALEGANSYYTEVPGIRANTMYCKAYPLAQRVEMNLIATDRILARHFLEI